MKEHYSYHEDDTGKWVVEGPGVYAAEETETDALNLVVALNTAHDKGISTFDDLYVVSMLLDRSEASRWHGKLWQRSVVADSKMAAVGTAVFTALEDTETKGFSVRSVGVISVADELDPTALPGPVEEAEKKED